MPNRCSICSGQTRLAFSVPATRLTGRQRPVEGPQCAYHECVACGFCFTDALESADHSQIYDERYWAEVDKDWYDRVGHTMRLFALAARRASQPVAGQRVLDFGCGQGAFVAVARELGFDVYGHDLNPPALGREHWIPDIGGQSFDAIIACEVVEHLTSPLNTFSALRSCLPVGGIFCFQTLLYEPGVTTGDWWYVGPANGHISFYSRSCLPILAERTGFVSLPDWPHSPNVQVWSAC